MVILETNYPPYPRFTLVVNLFSPLPAGAVAKNSACQCRRCERLRFDPWVGKIPWRREWQTAPIFLPGESHGQGSLVGYSPGGRKESDVTEHVHIFAPQNNGRIWASETLLHCDSSVD